MHWSLPVLDNIHTFEEIYNRNETVDPAVVENFLERRKEAAWNLIEAL